MLSRHAWLVVLVVFVGVGIAGDARAENKVDWSQYLEPPGARPVPVKHAEPAAQPAPKRAKASKGKAVKAKTAESRSKAKKKRGKGRR